MNYKRLVLLNNQVIKGKIIIIYLEYLELKKKEKNRDLEDRDFLTDDITI